ncbi:MAG: hypothetical protein QXP98_06555 [Thermoproteus sp.]
MSEAESVVAQNLARALSPESTRALSKLLDILMKADELGLLDTVRDLLDKEVIEGAAKSAISTGLFALLFNFEKVSGLLEALAKNADALSKLVSALEALNKSGLLDLLSSLAEPEVLGEATRAYFSTGTFYLLNEAPKLLDGLASMRISQALDSAINDSRAKQVPSFVESINYLLLDEDARRGLYFVVRLLKGIGASLRPR